MYKKVYISLFLIPVLLGTEIAPQAWAETVPKREYQVKAAFLYNFIKFIEWPKEKMAEPNQPIILGIIGKDPFANAFDPVKDKQIKGRKVIVKRFNSIVELKKLGETGKEQLDRRMEAIKECHVLFVCSSEKEYLKDIIGAVQKRPILTVADTKGFLKSGGIINFIMEKQKVRFEINTIDSKNSKLQIRSQLLRLAKRVIK